MTKIDRLIAAGCLAMGTVNLIVLLQARDRIEYSISGLKFIISIILGGPS